MKHILVLCLVLFSYNTLIAQQKLGVKSVIGAYASKKDNLGLNLTKPVNGVSTNFTISSVSMQVGMPYMGLTKGATISAASTQNYIKDLGFPWGIRYRYTTFSEDAFTVSKGYFSDRIELNWDIKKNQEKIISISVFRTEDLTSVNPTWGTPLKTLAGDVGTFSDTNVEGGKLYRYKIFAKGIEVDNLEIKYSNYITGIGYRNPTGVITGNISYTGGNPVKDVMIVANPTGSSLRFGSSLKVPSDSYIKVAKLNKSLKDSISIQTWMKPYADFGANEVLSLYSLSSDHNETLDFKIKMIGSQLTAYVGAHTITLTNYIPSGEIDNKGQDILVPIANLNKLFTHFSAVLRDNKIPEIYINGRLISAAYATKMNTILAQNPLNVPLTVAFTSTNTTVQLNTTTTGAPQSWNSFKMGGGKLAYLDEFRVWETALTPSQIQRDYRRYLKGNESYFNTYIRANEKSGDYAYDLAQTGFSFHGNDAKLSNAAVVPTWANSEDDTNNIPTNSQLGILGISDEFGNYVIASVPYSGNGDSFTIVPSLGKHEFNPKQDLAFLGVGSTVVNNVNFIDQSSFSFKGIVVYNSKGVFPATSDTPITGDIKDNEVYNAYTKGTLKYQKGEYWAEMDATGKTITSLKRYATIPVPGAYVNIDNAPAIDANNVPIQTDINGRFTIEVPIGSHAISITKSDHVFEFDGRFPAKTSSVIGGQTYYTNTYQDFFEDRDEPVTFIDNTKVIVVGRVVGGKIESDKTIGFGDTGKKTYAYKDAGGVDRTTVYTSLNNIGKARMTFGYLPVGATSITPEYKTIPTLTDGETGEFRVNLLPLSYQLSQNDLTFTSNKNPGDKSLLDADQSINFTAIKALQTPTFVQGDHTISGVPYQEVLKFTYMATPIYTVLSQTSDTEIKADGKTYTIATNQTPPIYSQFGNYSVRIQGQERYSNYDANAITPVISTVPVTGGAIIATNNLALENTENTVVDPTDSSVLIYTFKGGTPNTDAATNYTRTIDLKYRLNGVDTALQNYKTEGILLGGVADGTQTFVTAGPELPDFVLRDPPGSNSSATIVKGSSFSFSKENTSTANNGSDVNATVSLGFELSLGGGLLGPVMKTDVTNDISTGVSMAQSSSNGKSVTNTYTFNQTISTSDDPSWIGSDADLYIGTSANQFYGTYNELTASSSSPSSPTNPITVVPLSGSQISKVYPKINKAMYFNEAPEKTLFVYSQHSVLNDVIPKYLDIIKQIDAHTITENQNGVLTKAAYLSSINLWRKIILNNELAKYQALNDKDKLKTSLNTIIAGLKDPVTNTLSTSAKQLKDLLNATFYENVSLDAGVGEFTKSYQVERLSTNSLTYQLQIDSSVALAIGASFNNTGFEMQTSKSSGSGSGNTSADTNNETTNISYTLKDHDAGNLLSVDVINAFDGNGPIFITKGGETSCPYEGGELSHFYNLTHANVTDASATIVDLLDAQRVPLSVATMALEKPEITVVASNVSGVFEGRNAEFVLKLRNTSTINKDATFKLYVDQTTNPDNAQINIEPNGTLVTIPAGKTVSYTMTLKKVKQDQFNYPNVRIVLESACDGNAVANVLVSASFVPACSPVTIMSPPNDWLMNRNSAYDGAITKPLNIKLGGYNTSFASFQKINLEYRLKGTPNWTGLRTYYKNQADLTTAINGGDSNGQVIVGDQLNYTWDIAALGLGNGSYELRARTSCNNLTAYESEIITGSVDLIAPVVFGTPTPTNGILNLGDDITLRFNEPVKTNGTVTKFEFLVQKDQVPVNHEVSLAFNGSNNTATINKPAITSGDFSIEFWLKNSSLAGTSTLLSQSGGIKIELIDDVLKYTIGGQSISSSVTKDNTFNHYALSYDATANKLSIIENSTEKKSILLTTAINFTNENPMVVGGNTFKGNLHDLRFWKKYISRDMAVANAGSVLNGNEFGLMGYWPINEGNGIVANDLARFKDLVIANANWDIFPKGTAYTFDGTNYLALPEVSKVIISKEMDATLNFWMKTSQSGVATLLSNGKGDATDLVESNTYRNKWALNLNATGGIELQAEAKTYPFGSVKVNDNSWHHIAMSLTRNGTIRMYVDGNELASYSSADIGGFTSSTIFVGARGQMNSSISTIDNKYIGQIDELCFWNMARNATQIKADRYYEVDPQSTGLLLYSSFNKPDIANANGPLYYYPLNSVDKGSLYALLNGKPLAFTDIAPPIKPFRPTESIVVNAVINGDQIVLMPMISDWSSIEGKVANITVSNLNDMADNSQQSPVSWSVYINKNPTKWFVEGQGKVVNLMKRNNDNLTFDITIVNQGGLSQPYTIDIPSWLTLSSKSGTIAPNTTITIKASVDNNLAIGNYNTILSLATNYGYNEKIQLDLRVLEKEPILVLDPTKFTQSMNVIGKIKIDGVFTDDLYDKVVAIVNGEVRGMTNVIFDIALNEYFVYLTVYSNNLSGEDVIFYIWDASDGKLKEASLEGSSSVPFVADTLLGTYRIPTIFNNTKVTGQQIKLNQGWTWTSFNVADARFANLNLLTKGLSLSTSDLFESNSPAFFDAYQYNAINPSQSVWSGTISGNGGISNSKMYKIKLATAQNLNIKGIPVDLNTWSFNLAQNWNWLPYVVSKNVLVSDALANLNATDGDIIKSQSQFAIYTTSIGWKGSLTYLKVGEGYMMRINTPQNFTYPEYLNKSTAKKVSAKGTIEATSISLAIEGEEDIISSDYTQFSNTMNAVVKLPKGYQTLAFYNDLGELRGNSKTINIQGVDLAFITIYGNQPEKLTAFIGTGETLLGTTKTISFSSDSILGSIANPILIDVLEEKISIYPNPFQNELSIAIETKKSEQVTIVIRNLLGQEVYKKVSEITLGASVLKINPNLPAGIYIINIETADQMVMQKIIKI
jgi:hypothetical protein